MKKCEKKFRVICILFLILTAFLVSFGLVKNKNVFTTIAKNVKEDNATKPEIELSVDLDEENNLAILKWVNGKTGSFDFKVERSEDFTDTTHFHEISALPENPIQVLNISPTENKLLFDWMETNGYGKGLIKVTTVSIEDFGGTDDAKNYKKYLDENNYKYDLIVFGTWDSNGTKDLGTEESAKAVEKFIQAGHSVIFGHDTLAHSGCDTSDASKASSLCHPHLNILAKYAQIEFSGNTWDSSGNHSEWVTVSQAGSVFTSYPHSINDSLKDIPDNYYPEDNQSKGLKIPSAHTLGQTANGDIWLKFAYLGTEGKANELTIGNNYYLTTGQCKSDDCKKNGKLPAPCAMIQTGHSSGKATEDEQKIFANLIFYLWYITNSSKSSLEDREFTDRDAPNTPILVGSLSQNVLDNGSGTVVVNFASKDEGTYYQWIIEGTDNSNKSNIIKSNIVNATRLTGVSKYQYYVDGMENSDFTDNSEYQEMILNTVDKNETKQTVAVNVGDLEQTYLHIRAIDGAGNISKTAHILVYDANTIENPDTGAYINIVIITLISIGLIILITYIKKKRIIYKI